MASDARFMARALELAERGRGFVAPNPRVGAVLVRDGQVVAEGWHKVFGGPHAEAVCLQDAEKKGVDPKGCDLYVTLEPCNHFGKTPPCTRAVLEAGVKRVVIGCLDPNPDVAGGGADFLRQGGLDVVVGVLERECRDAIADFVVWKTTDRPYVQLKLAATLDGRIATRTGDAGWVSGEAARRQVHELRAAAQAVMVGGGTLRADNPQLNHRLDSGRLAQNPQPLAVAVTRQLPRPDAPLRLLADRPEQTVFFTGQAQASGAAAKKLSSLGVRVWALPERNGRLELLPGLVRLRAEAGVYTVLCEGGGGLAGALLAQGLLDELRLFYAPKVLGDERGVPAFSGLAVPRLADAFGLRFCDVRPVGEDLLVIARPAK